MSPTARFNTLVAGTTVFLMFWLVAYVAPLLQGAGVGHPLLVSAGALLTSVGLYRLLSIGVRLLMERSERIRAAVLGAHYVHGTWVGYFIGHAGDKRFMVEHFSQELDSLAISGRSFTEELSAHGQWTSEAAALDVRHGRLVFTYSFDVISRSSSLAGVHTSLLARPSARDAPTALSGFAHDLNDPTRIAVHSEMVSRELLPWDEALQIAVSRFKSKTA